MDELPSEARALLELARDGHDPPEDGARARVRQRLVVALMVPAAGAALGGGAGSEAVTGAAGGVSQGISGAWLGAKGWVVAGVLAAGMGGSTLVAWNRDAPRTAAPVPQAAEARAASDAPEPALAVRAPQPGLAAPPADPSDAPEPALAVRAPQPGLAAPPADPSVVAGVVAPVSRRPGRSAPLRGAGRGRLGDEMELLSQAARLLAQHDITGARALLDQHRGSFERSQLREEREGLVVLAQCMEQPLTARQRARLFVASAPASVLVARIEKACTLSANEQREEDP
jgi:hypothetical protein